MWQVTVVFLLRLAQRLVAAALPATAGPLNAVWMGLYQSPTSPITSTSTLANIVEANYDGYSRQLITWFPPFIAKSGPETLASQDMFYQPIDALVSNLITGVFIADAFYGGNLLMAAVAPGTGIVLGNPTEALKVQAEFQMSFLLGYGSPNLVF